MKGWFRNEKLPIRDEYFTMETDRRLVRNNDNGIRVVTKAHRTLQQEFPSPKFRPYIDLQTNVLYMISCTDCFWNYNGETGKKNTSEMSRTVLKDPTLQIMFGRIIIDYENLIGVMAYCHHNWSGQYNSKPLPRQYSIILQCDYSKRASLKKIYQSKTV